MRAVARGMVLRALPACPERCGGPHVDPSTMTAAVRSHRARHGCDADIPEGEPCHYAIRCPRCNGAAQHGGDCGLCSDGPMPGFHVMRRCPASQMTPDIAQAVQALSWAKRGVMPAPGGYADQSISFMEFAAAFEAEVSEAVEEQRKEGE